MLLALGRGKNVSPRAVIALGFALAVALCVIGVPSARADYEQVAEHFGVSGEAEQLENATAVAINMTGAGGVEPGTFYVAGLNGRVLRYGPGHESEGPSFREAWGWGVGNEASEYQRCGPALATDPVEHTFHTCTPSRPVGRFGGEESGHFQLLASVAVDQATGNVYVLNESEEIPQPREHHLVEIFSATGTAVGLGFGDAARKSPVESIAEAPGKLHALFPTGSALTVNEAGVVYVTDTDYAGTPNAQNRVASFKPQSPGDFEHYVYAGQQDDITTGRQSGSFRRLGLVGAGRLVTATQGTIREYAIGGGSTPVCAKSISGQVEAMAANPVNGEVFYYTFADRKIHRLEPCNEATGEFQEAQAAVKPTPVTGTMWGLAVNPGLAWGASRPAGTLYAVDGEEHTTPTIQRGIGDVFALAEVLSPTIKEESVANTSTVSTTLKALIDPRGFVSHYHFEYLSEAQYVADGESFAGPEVPGRAPVIGSGTVDAGGVGIAAVAITGLSPGTDYRFRVIATSECEGPSEPLCEATGEPATFRTYSSEPTGPADGRAYELVSPSDKHGGEVFPADPRTSSCLAENGCKPPGKAISEVFPMQSAPDGNAVAYMGYPFSPTEGAAVFNSYLARRTATGWQTTALSPALQATKESGNVALGGLALDGQLGKGIIGQASPQLSADAPVGYANLYLQNTVEPGVLDPIVRVAPPHRSPSSFVLNFAGYTPDFSVQLFAANDALTKASAFAPEPPDPGSAGRDLYEVHAGSLALVNVLPGNAAVAVGAAFASTSPDTHAVSADGRRVYWHAGSTLYVREDGAITREVKHSGSFLTASENGLQVLLSDGCLYSLLTELCTDLTQGGGGFQGIAGQSNDLSHIYFIDTAILAGSGENERHQSAQAGKPNLYLYEEGRQTRFITTLLPSDNVGGLGLGDWASAPGLRTAESSPNGRYLAFGSTARLTGYDNVGPCEQLKSGGELVLVDAPCAEVFLYDSQSGGLACPSCNPTGEAPRGLSTLRRIAEAPPTLPQPRYLTDSGRLFFDSGDRLSALDTNGRVEDVYEAEPAGVGTCAVATGCLSLISTGIGSVDSNFLAADSSGKNVFFTTRERLVAKDTDELVDLYDAREGGGFSGEGETSAGPCAGEACQTQVPAPAYSPPSSQSFEGSGNVVPSKEMKQQQKKPQKKHHKKKSKKNQQSRKRANAQHHVHGGQK